jgi:para-nitrobenzyl esterase
MRLAWLLALGIALLACKAPPETPVPDWESRRGTPSGTVVGFVGRYGSYAWLGLPYAAPPTGERRWRAPEPPAPWSGVREALRPGSSCVQYASPLGGVDAAAVGTPVGDEDCLYLNVYAPRTATPTSFLPVMVWLHGGGNTIGTGSRYDGGNLAVTGNVVVVTLNYRLGPFGWFRHAAIRAAAADDAERSGDFTTLDLVRALDWVQSHIAAFGGDPARVTIFGESAGATNVMTLLVSPQSVGLFHRAILESGGVRTSDPDAAEAFADAPNAETANSSNEAIARVLVASGVARDRADAKTAIAATAPAELAARLRATSARDLLAAYPPQGTGMIRMPTAIRDGAVLPAAPPLDVLRHADGWNRVPVIVGTNRDEIKLFMFISPQWVRRWFGFVPRLVEPAPYDAVADAVSHVWKATGADEVASAMVASGARDVFVYRFDWDEEPAILGADLSRMLGAAHGLEIPFVFGHFDLGRQANRFFTVANEPGRRELASAMMGYWTTFAATGNPGGGDGTRPAWPAWSAGAETLVLDTSAGGGIRTMPGALTRDAVVAAIESDPRYADPRTRCLAYHDLVVFQGAMTRDAYDARCAAYPFDGYPWRS